MPGNHESECHSLHCILNSEIRHSLKNFSAYNNRFHMPYAESGSSSNMWYSFNYGLAHFVALNTETDYKGAPEGLRYQCKIFANNDNNMTSSYGYE